MADPSGVNTLTVIVALSRRERLASVIARYRWQTLPNKRLIVVENGPARGVLRDAAATLPSGTVCLQSDHGLAALPRNTGLAWIQANGGSFVTFWDDDDYYGPEYLSEAWAAMQERPRSLVGKALRYVRLDDGLYCCLGDNQIGLTGGACGGHSSVLRPFPLQRVSEDHEWCVEALSRGVELTKLGARHFIYNRVGSAARMLRATATQFLFVFGPAYYYGHVPDALSHDEPAPGALMPKPTEQMLADDLIRSVGPFEPAM